MIPLPHAPMTVVKLHGDYAMLGLRNTPEELGTYPLEWNDLRARVFDEHGLAWPGMHFLSNFDLSRRHDD
jgi:hypothetical protein